MGMLSCGTANTSGGCWQWLRNRCARNSRRRAGRRSGRRPGTARPRNRRQHPWGFPQGPFTSPGAASGHGWPSAFRSLRISAQVPQPTSDCPDRTHLRGLLDGSLTPDQQEQIRLHLDTCTFCQQIVDSLSDHKLPAAAPLVVRDEPACVEAIERLLQHAGAHADSPDVTGADWGSSFDFLQPSRQPDYIGRLGHYEIIEPIGRGGMGIVLRAFDEKLRRVVAIKVMAPQIATSVSARKRFVREAQAAAAVRNEHVIDIHAVEDAGALPYLVMEYIDGISLAERTKRSGPLKLHKVLRIGMQTATGLAAAHAQGLVHRDIKPENILLENGVERVKITDFGLARAVDDVSLTQSGVLTGTPQYMSPEQARGEPVDHRSDLFSLGCVLYAMCTGYPPFCAETTVAILKRVTDDTRRPVRSLNAEVTEELAALTEKLLAKDPGQRFQTAAEVSALLGRQLAQLQQPAQPPLTSASRLPQKRKLSRWLVAMLVLLSGLGLAGYQFSSTINRFFTGQPVIESDTGAPVVPASEKHNGEQVAVDDGQAHREPALATFALLARDGAAERPFTTLAEAVVAADSGDIVEVRGDGPIIRESIFLHDKALTIRAAPGRRPVLEFSAESEATPGYFVRLQTAQIGRASCRRGS